MLLRFYYGIVAITKNVRSMYSLYNSQGHSTEFSDIIVYKEKMFVIHFNDITPYDTY